nr:MAG TPA: hypothetical protein [Caudoviricetes sp.]
MPIYLSYGSIRTTKIKIFLSRIFIRSKMICI